MNCDSIEKLLRNCFRFRITSQLWKVWYKKITFCLIDAWHSRQVCELVSILSTTFVSVIACLFPYSFFPCQEPSLFITRQMHGCPLSQALLLRELYYLFIAHYLDEFNTSLNLANVDKACYIFLTNIQSLLISEWQFRLSKSTQNLSIASPSLYR